MFQLEGGYIWIPACFQRIWKSGVKLWNPQKWTEIQIWSWIPLRHSSWHLNYITSIWENWPANHYYRLIFLTNHETAWRLDEKLLWMLPWTIVYLPLIKVSAHLIFLWRKYQKHSETLIYLIPYCPSGEYCVPNVGVWKEAYDIAEVLQVQTSLTQSGVLEACSTKACVFTWM